MKLLSTIVIALTLATVVFAYPQKTRRAGVLVNPNKPDVFLSFLRVMRIAPDDPTDDPDNLFFRLTNNSQWPIWLQMSGVSKKGYGEASLYYAIEDKATVL